MNYNNPDELNNKISKVCTQFQEERPSGLWYITQTGLNKVAKLLGGDYSSLTKKQRKVFRRDCVDNAHMGGEVRSWWYYLNCEL